MLRPAPRAAAATVLALALAACQSSRAPTGADTFAAAPPPPASFPGGGFAQQGAALPPPGGAGLPPGAVAPGTYPPAGGIPPGGTGLPPGAMAAAPGMATAPGMGLPGDAGAVPMGAAGPSVMGGIASSEAGRALAPADMQRAAQAELYALESAPAGVEYAWSSPETGARGTIVSGELYEINRSQCRDYTHNVFATGGQQTVRGTACRQPNGTWRSVTG